MENIPLWLCIPFAGLLLCIAIFPLIKEEWWDKKPDADSHWDIFPIPRDMMGADHTLEQNPGYN